jgi:ribonuclease HI
MGEFKELNIDRSKLEDEVAKYMSSKGALNYNFTSHPKFKRLEYSIDHAKVMVDFYDLKNGTTTIRYNIGSNPELGKELAIHLKENINFDNRKNLYLTIKDFEVYIFELLELFFREKPDGEVEKYSISETQNDEAHRSIQIKCILYNDCITVTFYKTTNILLIQGKPLYTFSQLTYFLSEHTDLDGFLSIVTKVDPKQIDEINREETEDIYDKSLSNAKSFLKGNLEKMIMTSLLIDSMPIKMPDYAYIVYPALRALEGVLKKIFSDNGISVSGRKFSEIFRKNEFGKFKLTDDMELQLDNKMWAPLCDCYQFFHSQRHTLFHTQEFAEASRMIEDKDEASKIIQKTLKIIDDTYLRIK